MATPHLQGYFTNALEIYHTVPRFHTDKDEQHRQYGVIKKESIFTASLHAPTSVNFWLVSCRCLYCRPTCSPACSISESLEELIFKMTEMLLVILGPNKTLDTTQGFVCECDKREREKRETIEHTMTKNVCAECE